jgi:hypothetical protein
MIMKNRMIDITRLGMLLLALNFAMVSCSKDDDSSEEENPPAQSDDPDTFPTPSDADGVLVAVKSVSITDTPIGPIEVVLGTAVGVFTDDGFSSGDFIGAGTVECNTSALAMNANSSYTFTDITATNPTGLDFNNDIQWEVSGANGIPTISYNADVFGFPSVSGITSADVVDKANGYTVTCNSVAGADSVLFLIGGATKTIAGNATSCNFSSAELADVDTGASVVQIAAYVTNPVDFGSARIYFINEYVQSQSVTVQ